MHHILNLVDFAVRIWQLLLVLKVDCWNFLALYDIFLLRLASEFAAEQLATGKLEPRPSSAPLDQVFRVILAQSEAKERLRCEQLGWVSSFLLDRRYMDIVEIGKNLCIQHVLGGTMLLVQDFQVFLCEHRGFFPFFLLFFALVLDCNSAQAFAEAALERTFPLRLPVLEHQLRMGGKALHWAIVQREGCRLTHDRAILVPRDEACAVAVGELLVREGMVHTEGGWVLFVAQLGLPMLVAARVEVRARRSWGHDWAIFEHVLRRSVDRGLALGVEVVLPLGIEIVGKRILLVGDILMYFWWRISSEVMQFVDAILKSAVVENTSHW
jgi:hypothetical protein